MMFRHLALIRLLATLLFFSTGCQKDFSAEVSISGIGPNITKLRVYAWRDRQLAHDRHYDVSENLTDLHIRVPLDEHTKELELVVLGLASETEMRSQGYAKFDVGTTSIPNPIQLVETEQLRLATAFSCRNTGKTTETICDIPLIHTAAEDVYWRLSNHLLDRTLDQFSWPVAEHLNSKLNNFDSLGANYAVVVSEDGSVHECNGNTCGELQNPAKSSLCGVHIKKKGLAFVVGASGTILKCEGGVCTKQQSSTGNRLCGVIVGNGDELRVVGDKGTILRCEDGRCRSMNQGLTDQNLNAIWGSDPNHFWVVGDGGTVFRCEQSCTKIESTTTHNLAGVWGSDFSSVFVVGDQGTLLVCSESGCTVPPGEKTTSDLKSIHGNQADNVIVSGTSNTTLRWNGHGWKKISGNPLRTILTVSVGASWSVTVEPSAEPVVLQVPSWATEFQVTASVNDPAAAIQINGKPLASGTTSQPIGFKRDMATATVPVVVQALGTAARAYSITVTRPASNYLKASNTDPKDYFGSSVSLFGDTLVVGASGEASGATGVNRGHTDNTASESGAVYVFVRTGGNWTQQAYLKASNTDPKDHFGSSVSLFGDTLVVGASGEASNATGGQFDNTASESGAVYVFVRTEGIWTQQAYLKAFNADPNDHFGSSVSLFGDTLVVGASGEGSGGEFTDSESGAVYVFVRTGENWTQQAYLKAFNADPNDHFGSSVSLFGDTLVVGASGEDSRVHGDPADNTASESGAVYVFARTGRNWTQQAYLKASSPAPNDHFGSSVALFGDTLAVGAYAVGEVMESYTESSRSGAVYVFVRTGTTWTPQADLTASNSNGAWGGEFGYSVSLFEDTLAVGARSESSNATGVDGDQADNSAQASGAAYVFVRAGGMWTQKAYLKASNTDKGDLFSSSISLFGDTVAISAPMESGHTKGINGDQFDNDATSSGAVYVF